MVTYQGTVLYYKQQADLQAQRSKAPADISYAKELAGIYHEGQARIFHVKQMAASAALRARPSVRPIDTKPHPEGQARSSFIRRVVDILRPRGTEPYNHTLMVTFADNRIVSVLVEPGPGHEARLAQARRSIEQLAPTGVVEGTGSGSYALTYMSEGKHYPYIDPLSLTAQP